LSTVFELFDEAVRPVLDAVPNRATIDDLYTPGATEEDLLAARRHSGSEDPADLVAEAERHNAMAAAMSHMGLGEFGELNETGERVFSVMLRGPIRSVLTGVHENAPSPLDIRCYADDRAGIVWSWRPDGSSLVKGAGFREFPDRVADCLPAHHDGRLSTIRIAADENGVVPESHEDDVAALRSFFARKRVGTILVDFIAYDTLFAEYPRHGFALIDNDLGRFALTVHDTTIGPGCTLQLCEFSGDALASWMEEGIELAMATRDDE
jgi:hypothetical protein